ncbi:hypothetical protein Q5P01_008498 [Channa striata]|uniref:Integrin alpha-2 domain-containing protein n=1 Tax=Channa striata TaxID=64152 RepID=A0AA88N578_CHASR|nr:hypothetical protein Q5P01_008498 [Channa striata]
MLFCSSDIFTYTAHSASFNPKLILNYTFEADTERRKSRLAPRVDFLGLSQGKLEVQGQGSEICTETKLQLLRDIKDRLHSIPISVSVSLWSSSQTTRTRAELPDVAPVLSLLQPKSTFAEIILINKGCGSDNICQKRMVFAVIIPSDENIALEITVTNRNRDDAHQSHATISLPDTLHYSFVIYNKTAETQVSCTANDNGTLIDCELGNPFQRDAEVPFYVILTTSGISLSTNDITLQLETLYRQWRHWPNWFELQLQVHGLARPSQVSLGKSLMGEGAIKSVDDIGALVNYEFRITNMGRPLKSSANVSLSIYWPKETSAGKWLLYLTQIKSDDVQLVSCSPVNEINQLKHIEVSHERSRRRREAEHQALSTDREIHISSNKQEIQNIEKH